MSCLYSLISISSTIVMAPKSCNKGNDKEVMDSKTENQKCIEPYQIKNCSVTSHRTATTPREAR